MKIPALFRFAFCAFVATALSLTASAQTAAGQIKAAKVEGQVTKISASGASVPLKSGDTLAESDAVLTGKGASVVLVFSNGSSVKVGSESRLAIDEFKMDPLAEEIKPSELKGEPSVSKTTLNLAYGEMVGDVKKLNKSSSYSIKTPVGAAGIRGTIYRIVFKPSTDGKAFFTVSTAEGHVVMQGITDTDIPVDEGKEVVIQVDTDNPSNPVIVTQDIPAATKALITAAAQVITEEVAKTVIPPATDTSTDTSDKKQQSTDTNPAPPPPNLTPGAGE
jgi:hypothetical protein